MIRVLVADDHAWVRRGIRALLERAADIEVVGEAQDGKEAVDLAKQLEPDLVIMDISMPKMDGIKATARIHLDHLASQVIILSMHANRSLARQALHNGAKGYILKRSVTDELLPAIHQVLQGEIYLSHILDSQPS